MKKLALAGYLAMVAGTGFGAQSDDLLAGVSKSLESIRQIKSEVVDAGNTDQIGSLSFVFGATVKEEGNRFDKKVEERILEIEDELVEAGDLLSEAAVLLPSRKGQNLFSKACAIVVSAEVNVERAIEFTKRSNLFEPSEFNELSEELDFALELANCL